MDVEAHPLDGLQPTGDTVEEIEAALERTRAAIAAAAAEHASQPEKRRVLLVSGKPADLVEFDRRAAEGKALREMLDTRAADLLVLLEEARKREHYHDLKTRLSDYRTEVNAFCQVLDREWDPAARRLGELLAQWRALELKAAGLRNRIHADKDHAKAPEFATVESIVQVLRAHGELKCDDLPGVTKLPPLREGTNGQYHWVGRR